jgi:hypothetical protein
MIPTVTNNRFQASLIKCTSRVVLQLTRGWHSVCPRYAGFPRTHVGWASRYLHGMRIRLVRFLQNHVMGLRRDTTLHKSMEEVTKMKAGVVWW